MYMDLTNFLPGFNPIVLTALLIWALFWKALALWRAAKGAQRYWFIVLLIVNTFGILEIIYLFGFAKNKMTIKDLRDLSFLP